MSIEEIIHNWKNGLLSVKALHPTQKTEKTPANPIGDMELSDEELEAAEGGLPEFINSLNESCYEICEYKE